MSRILSKELDSAAEAMADRVEPVMRDTFFRIQSLEFEFDDGQWQTILAALTEKIPKRLKSLPVQKDDRLEILGLIDIIDRTVREKGSRETAETMLKALVAVSDLFEQFRNTLRLRVKQNGVDITEEVFGGN